MNSRCVIMVLLFFVCGGVTNKFIEVPESALCSVRLRIIHTDETAQCTWM
jgi:hypothetical protein